MVPLSESIFSIFALSLERGHAFGQSPPIGAWQSNDRLTCGIITLNDETQMYGLLVMRRRQDDVWKVICKQKNTRRTESQAKADLESIIRQKEGTEKEPIPPGVRRRPSLARFKKKPCKLFEYIGTPNHHVAAWILNQVYLAMPNPDPNWASDCQTGNFHTRLWEAYLLACFREQGLLVKQDFDAPDFHISNRHGDQAWVEAVTANPEIPYEHVGSTPKPLPKNIDDLLDGPAVLRFHNTLRNKLDKEYDKLEHVVD